MSGPASSISARRGVHRADGLRFALLVSRFHSDVTERLLDGARNCLVEHGARPADLDIIRVPGAWELPQTAAKLVAVPRHDALIALGCVVRGETPHFEYVCQEASAGLGAVARAASIPVMFGVLTTDTLEQAYARAGEGVDNKGYECALGALEMIDVYRKLAER